MNSHTTGWKPRARLAAIPAAAMLFALSQGAGAQAIANQSLEERLNTQPVHDVLRVGRIGCVSVKRSIE
ncbi:hypothetical protein H3V53_41030 [Paraburkholderia bengalensis]|uniref:Uncharacterized protein n=1 Tax=Paraburkholderia bengalensis TaxID=2747562 RepID=A0ABU8J6E7_9BURK